MSDDVVIRVDGLWKRYGLPLAGFVQHGRRSLRSLRGGRNRKSKIENRKSDDGPWALRDVSFEACPELGRRVKRGEVVGIPSAKLRASIGCNGADKSTLRGGTAWAQ